MKKILIILSFFALIACENLEDLNKNTKDPAVVPGETLFTGAQRRMVNRAHKHQCKPEQLQTVCSVLDRNHLYG